MGNTILDIICGMGIMLLPEGNLTHYLRNRNYDKLDNGYFRMDRALNAQELRIVRNKSKLGNNNAQLDIYFHFTWNPRINKTLSFNFLTRTFKTLYGVYQEYKLESQRKCYRIRSDQRRSKIALHFLEKAAHNGNTDAMHLLGNIQNTFSSIGKFDVNQSIEWYKKSANAGHSGSQYNLAISYQYGEGSLQINHKKALEYFLNSSQAGNTYATIALCFYYHINSQELEELQPYLEYMQKRCRIFDICMIIIKDHKLSCCQPLSQFLRNVDAFKISKK